MGSKKRKRKILTASAAKKARTFNFRKIELKRFFYWINERHSIYLKKLAGEGRKDKGYPWTKDPILRSYRFTNPFRQNDKVTKQWADRYATLMALEKTGQQIPDDLILFHLCMFRLFNYAPTYDALNFGIMKHGGKWDKEKAIAILKERRDGENSTDTQIFTGAYMITPGGYKDKIEAYCNVLDQLWDGRTEKQKAKRRSKPRRVRWAAIIRKRQSMRRATKLLCKLECVGPFIAYEIVCDLRHTRILADAKDIDTWANAGPGAKRGIHRLLTGDKEWGKGRGPSPRYNLAMRALLRIARRKGILSKDVLACEWPLNMREIEHSLCEYDKHSRVRMKQGKPRSTYKKPDPQMQLPWEDGE